jgi:hypothetical protein
MRRLLYTLIDLSCYERGRRFSMGMGGICCEDVLCCLMLIELIFIINVYIVDLIKERSIWRIVRST